MQRYNDIAIPLAWLDQTARGDELWMSFFKKLGVVKNLNFKVGHAAIVLVERKSGLIKYYDFGRYIVPRGYGRARSAEFDPRLKIDTKAQFDENGELQNLNAILLELRAKEAATHGGGKLLCSVSYHISFEKAVKFAEDLVDQGPILYGALAARNNSCSRYVAQILVEGMEPGDKRIQKILYPENIKASPTSNVVNAVEDNEIVVLERNVIEKWKLNRWESLKFQIGLLKPNFFSSHAKSLPDDNILGYIDEPFKPIHVPEQATWLGGLGEGSWFYLQENTFGYEIRKYNAKGETEYQVMAQADEDLDMEKPFEFSYHVHYHKHIIKQNQKEIIFLTIHMADQAIKQSI